MKLSNMANVLRGYGLTVVETPNWKTRGYAGQDLAEIRGVIHHHTATHRSRFNMDAPTLQLCIDGRADLPGPLCQLVLGRSGTVYIVAAGVGNHAGMGQAYGIPDHTGNHYFIGIEMESSGIAPFDWTADQLRVAPYLGAALELGYLQHLPEAERLQLGHMEYSTQGKIDPAGWPGGMDGMRESINLRIAELRKGTKPKPATAKPAPSVPAKGAARKVTASTGWIRTEPRASAKPIKAFPEGLANGAELSIIGYCAGLDPFPTDGKDDDAWLVTGSGTTVTGYIWANGAGNSLDGLPQIINPTTKAAAADNKRVTGPLHGRTVTASVAWLRTAPRKGAPLAKGWAKGAKKGTGLAVRGYVAGEDPFPHDGRSDDAWLLTVSGFYVWANSVANDSLAGLPRL